MNYREYLAEKERLSLHERAMDIEEQYPAFIENAKMHFIEAAIGSIYRQALDKVSISGDLYIAYNILGDYIMDNSPDAIAESFKNSGSILMLEFYDAYNTAVTKVIKETDKDNPETFVIDPETEQEFYDNISDSDNIEDIASTLKRKVIDAEERMEVDNLQDKADTEAIISQAAEQIKSQKDQADESSGTITAEMVKEAVDEINFNAKKRIEGISDLRNRCVLEQIVRNIAVESLGDDKMKDAYLEASGTINFNKVINTSKIIYTFMEMTALLGIEKYTKDTIVESVKIIS